MCSITEEIIKTALFVCQGADGVEYLLIPVDNGTLTDFLEKNDVEWNRENINALHVNSTWSDK